MSFAPEVRLFLTRPAMDTILSRYDRMGLGRHVTEIIGNKQNQCLQAWEDVPRLESPKCRNTKQCGDLFPFTYSASMSSNCVENVFFYIYWEQGLKEGMA